MDGSDERKREGAYLEIRPEAATKWSYETRAGRGCGNVSWNHPLLLPVPVVGAAIRLRAFASSFLTGKGQAARLSLFALLARIVKFCYNSIVKCEPFKGLAR
jgi:hypothetical protein